MCCAAGDEEDERQHGHAGDGVGGGAVDGGSASAEEDAEGQRDEVNVWKGKPAALEASRGGGIR